MGNVACIDEMKYAHETVIRKVERKRQQGRPRRSYKESIEKEKRVKAMENGNVDCNSAGLCRDCLTLKMTPLRSIEATVTIHQSTRCEVT